MENNQDGPKSVTFSGAGAFSPCDNQFHTVTITRQGTDLHLLVDDDNFNFSGDGVVATNTLGAISVGGFPGKLCNTKHWYPPHPSTIMSQNY